MTRTKTGTNFIASKGTEHLSRSFLQIANRPDKPKGKTQPVANPRGSEGKNTMAKNEKNSTATKSATSASLARLAAIKAKQEEARKLLAALAAEAENESKAIKEEVAEKIATLPELFGVSTVADVRSLISDYLRQASTGNSPRTKFSAEAKAKAIELYKAGRKPDSTPEERVAGQRSAIMATIGCSAPTLQNWLDEKGLVNKRTATV